MSFKFNLDQRVKLCETDESGIVIARAEYSADEDRYLVRYKAGDNRMVDSWWGASAVICAPDAPAV